MQQVMFGMRIIGPAIAALLVASFGPRVCYIVDSASFLASGCLIATLAISRPQEEAVLAAEERGSPAPQLHASPASSPTCARASASSCITPALFFVILALASGMFVLGCFGPLIAVYVRDSLHASTRVFGIASAMIGLGMFLGVNGLNTLGKRISNSAARLRRPRRHRGSAFAS